MPAKLLEQGLPSERRSNLREPGLEQGLPSAGAHERPHQPGPHQHEEEPGFCYRRMFVAEPPDWPAYPSMQTVAAELLRRGTRIVTGTLTETCGILHVEEGRTSFAVEWLLEAYPGRPVGGKPAGGKQGSAEEEVTSAWCCFEHADQWIFEGCSFPHRVEARPVDAVTRDERPGKGPGNIPRKRQRKEPAAPRGDPDVICVFFQRDGCKYGNRCYHKHELHEPNAELYAAPRGGIGGPPRGNWANDHGGRPHVAGGGGGGEGGTALEEREGA